VRASIKPASEGSDSYLFEGLEHCRDLGVHTFLNITIYALDSINAIGPAPPRDCLTLMPVNNNGKKTATLHAQHLPKIQRS